jgi:hypothetical protein
MAKRKHNRVLNGFLALVFLMLTLLFPVPGILHAHQAAARVAASGKVVFDSDNVNSSAKTTSYIILFLGASLTLIFGYRAIQPAKADKK